MDRTKTLRNVAVIFALGAVVYFVPQGGRAASTFGAVLSVSFAAALAFFAGRLYLEHRVTVYGLGDRRRGLLYGALAVAVVTIAAQPRMFQTGAGELVWFVILGAVVGALVHLFRYSRSY